MGTTRDAWMTTGEPPDAPRKATPLQVAKAVLSAFIGIRKGAAHERDIATITPVQAIVAGIHAAAVFVLGVILVEAFISQLGEYDVESIGALLHTRSVLLADHGIDCA